MKVELYKNFPVYAIVRNESEVEKIRRMWENDVFPRGVYAARVDSEKVFYSILDEIDEEVGTGVIGFLNRMIVTDIEGVVKMLLEKNYVVTFYPRVYDVFGKY